MLNRWKSESDFAQTAIPGNPSRDASVLYPLRRFLSPADSIFAQSSLDFTGSLLNELHDEYDVKLLLLFPWLI